MYSRGWHLLTLVSEIFQTHLISSHQCYLVCVSSASCGCCRVCELIINLVSVWNSLKNRLVATPRVHEQYFKTRLINYNYDLFLYISIYVF